MCIPSINDAAAQACVVATASAMVGVADTCESGSSQLVLVGNDVGRPDASEAVRELTVLTSAAGLLCAPVAVGNTSHGSLVVLAQVRVVRQERTQ